MASTRLPDPRLATTLGLLLAGAFAAIAYHGLLFWDPQSHAYPAVVGWFFEASDTSPQIVFGIVLWLLFRRRRQLRDAVGAATSPGLAGLSLTASVGFQVWAQWIDAPDWTLVSLALAVLGAGLLFGGRPLARLLAAPLAVLLFAIPFPGAFYNHIVYPAQRASAGLADLGLRALGYDVRLQADILTLADGRKFEVIETCSGLRSVQTLALLAAVWALYFRCSARHAGWLLAATPIIAFLTNGIRVLILVLDPRPEVQESHAAQGMLMFLVGTMALSGVDRVLLRLLGRAANAVPAPEVARSARANYGRRSAGLALVLLVMAAAALGLPGQRPAAPALEPPPALPLELAGWHASEAPVAGHYLGNVYFTQRSNLVYERDGQSISAMLGWDDRRLRLRSLLSEKNAVPGSGWVVEEREPVELAPSGTRMERVVARRFAVRSVTFHAYRGSAGVSSETLRETLGLDQPGSPFARSGYAGVLRVSTLVQPGSEGIRGAEERLRGFLQELLPTLAW